jgi:hypothetical protein
MTVIPAEAGTTVLRLWFQRRAGDEPVARVQACAFCSRRLRGKRNW